MTVKGVKRSFVENHLRHEKYSNVLRTREKTEATFLNFRSRCHTIEIIRQTKTCFCPPTTTSDSFCAMISQSLLTGTYVLAISLSGRCCERLSSFVVFIIFVVAYIFVVLRSNIIVVHRCLYFCS